MTKNIDLGSVEHVPIIDLSNKNKSEVIKEISQACQTYGFFQVNNHGIPLSFLQELRSAMKAFFQLSNAQKDALRRNERNSRGYFDDELTKQKRDWKECLDVGVPGSKNWNIPDDHPKNACLDGFNQFPDKVLPEFRSTIVQYFQACETLSHQIAVYMAIGLGVSQEGLAECNGADDSERLVQLLRKDHTSYLRLNYYPPCSKNDTIEDQLGISPHTDAGFLTVLIQDDDCHSLQVAKHRQANDNDGSSLEWMTVQPVPGALTINTGDMCAIWSNGQYKAPLHRVLTNNEKPRYSAPFFYNPPYRTVITPLTCLVQSSSLSKQNFLDSNFASSNDSCNYTHPCVWGYFRAVRFAGDLTDFGSEIQISDYAKGSTSTNPIKQDKFLKAAKFNEPFSVAKYRSLLVDDGSGVKTES